ncbi:MAG: hypothetical protein AAGF59_13620 [Pseudomonadota bacterium]
MRLFISAACFVLLSSAVLAENIPAERIPPHILAIAKNQLPEAEFTGARVDIDYDGAAYELFGELPDGSAVEMDIDPDGEIHEIETVIRPNTVPAEILALAKKYIPEFEIVLAEISERFAPNEIIYELDIKLPSGAEFALEIDEGAGQILILESSGD